MTTSPRSQALHGIEASAVVKELGVEPGRGLGAGEAAERLRTHGPNRLTATKKESGFQAFMRQYQDFMQLVLLAAAVINQLVTGDTATTVVLAGLTLFNALVGLRQEAKAGESVKALAQMMKTIARVRRDGQAIEINAEELVPGDVVLVEAGNRVPADGRIIVAATLEIEEGALTGESLPVAKATEPVPGDEVALGDRTCMAYMNTSVTRGRGEMVVTATGMQTEIGHIADLLSKTLAIKTPLQKQLDSLSKIIAGIAGVALVLVILLGLANGQTFDTLFITGVALAVAAIPTGLPAVVTALLSIGHARDCTSQRDREAAACGGDPWLDLSDLLGQDRDADAQQDDRTPARDPRTQPFHRLRRGLRHRRRDQARGRQQHRPRPLLAPDDLVR